MKNDKNVRPATKARISRISIVDQVCDAIKKDIADKVWAPGDKLPSESELADFFGVNRLSVRMALQKLSTLGLIETRVGEGSFVHAFSFKQFLSEISFLYEDEEASKDVIELRNLLEGECMRLAVSTATQQEKDTLNALYQEFNAKAAAYTADVDNSNLLEEVVEADFEFHYQIIKMSHNHLYKDIYYMVRQLIRTQIADLFSTRCRRRKEANLAPLIDVTHQKMLESILSGDLVSGQKAREEVLGIRPMPGADIFD